MKTRTENVVETLAGDPEVIRAREGRETAARELKSAEEARGQSRVAGAAATVTLATLQADERMRHAEEQHTEARQHLAAVERAVRERIVAVRQPGRLERLRHLLDTATAAHRAAVEVRDWIAATGRAVEGNEDRSFPLAELLTLSEGLERLRRLVEGPRAEDVRPTPAPPRGGEVMLRLVAKVNDGLRFHLPGDRAAFAPVIAADLIKRGLAEKVG